MVEPFQGDNHTLDIAEVQVVSFKGEQMSKSISVAILACVTLYVTAVPVLQAGPPGLGTRRRISRC